MMDLLPRILIAIGLEILLLAVRLLCRKRRLALIPIRLPSVAILVWLIFSTLPAALLSPAIRPWMEAALVLSRSYALLQLIVWATLELPSVLPWWPRPAKILRDLAMLLVAAAITVVVVQEQARINVVGLVTTSAILTAVIGLAAQESLKDFFAGIVLQIDSPFQEGDFITAGEGIEGWVVSLTVMSTRLRHVHGALITMPNSRMWGTEIRRFGPRGPIAREIHLNLALSHPPEQATALLMQVARRHPLVLQEPEPSAFVYSYADHSITYELEVWQEDPTDNGFDVLRGQLLSQIWYALKRDGKTLPYPVREQRWLLPSDEIEVDDPAGYDVAARLKLLTQNALFGHLSHDQLEAIAPLTRCIRFAEGEAVIIEGDEGDALFQVVSGRVQVLKQLEGGISKPVAQLGPGAIFGEMSVFSEEPRSATVRSLQESVLLEVERDDLRPLLEGNPTLVATLAELIGERRAQLSSLSSEVRKAQTHQLLQTMQQMFSALTSGDPSERR